MLISLSPFSNMMCQNAMPLRQTFNVVKFYGEGLVDGCHAKNREWTNAEIIAIPDEEIFGVDSIFCAILDNNLEAGTYPTLINDIDYYKIQKRKSDALVYTDVANVTHASGLTTYVDYSSKNFQSYVYSISPVDITGIVGFDQTKFGSHNFFGWYLSAIDNSVCYRFDMNLQSDAIKRNEDVKIYDNYTQYAVISTGVRKYLSGKLSTMPYSISISGEDYEIDLETLDLVRDFITNGEQKYLRNTIGEVWKVNTKGFENKFLDNIIENPYNIQFEFIQTNLGLCE